MILRRSLLLLFLFISFTAKSQVFPNLDSLRKYINIYIRNSAVESFTNLRLNRSLNGLVDFIDATTSSANINNTSVGNGIKVAVDGSRQIKSMTAGYGLLVDSSVFNQVNYRADTAKLYGDIRKIRKVDTLFAVSDTLLRGTINGDTFNITIKGVAGLGNTNAGAGYKLAYSGSDSIKSLRAGYGINLDSATIGEVKITSDSATIYSYIRNNLRKVDSIYAFNDTTIKAVIMGTTYSLVIKGATGTGNTSVGSGYRVAINGTTNIKSLTSGFGVLLDSATTNQVNVKADTSALYNSFRGIINSSTAITSLTGDVTGTGPGATATTISNSVVTNAKLRNSAAYSVIGRKDTTSGVVADISATAYGQVLKRDSSGLTWAYLDSTSIPQFYSKTYYDNWYLKINAAKNYIKNAGAGTELTFISGDTTKVKRLQGAGGLSISRNVDSSLTLTVTGDGVGATGFTGDVNSSGSLPTLTATIATNAVSNQKFRQSAAFAVVGNSTNATANVQDIIAASNGLVLRRVADTLKFGQLDSTSIPALHSESYYNTKYLLGPFIKNYVQNAGSGTELSYKLSDSVKIKRVQAGTGIGIVRNADSSLTLSTTAVLPSSVKTYIQNVGAGSQLTYQLADSVKVKRLQAGTNITFTQNADSSISISSAGGSGTVTLTGAVTGSGSGTIATSFGAGTALSVLGNATSVSAVPTYVASSADFQVLKRYGTSLIWGTLDSTNVPAVRSEAYYNTKYLGLNNAKNYIKNAGAGVELSYQQVDSVKIKRIQAGTGVTVTRNTDSSLTLASSITQGYTSLGGDVTVTGLPAGTVSINANAVTNSDLRKSAGLSVIGNATSTLADVADITAAADFQVLKRSGTALVFGTLDSTNVPALHTEAYYNTKYLTPLGVDDRVKNIGTGVELSFNRNDSVNIKRVQAGTGMTIVRNADSSLTVNTTAILPSSVKTLVQNVGVGTQLSYQLVDSVKIKRLQAGTNITLTQNTDSSLTITAAGAGATTLTGAVTGTGTGTVPTTFGSAAALSVLSNATNAAAVPTYISPSADFQVLKRAGTTLTWGTLDSTNVPALRSEGYYNGKYLGINNTKNYIKNTSTGVNLTYQQVDTVRVKGIQAGTLINIVRNADSSLTINATGDGVGITSLIGDVTSAGTPTATTTIGANKVLSSMLRQSPAFSVIGNSGTILANVTDIAAATDGHVLKRLSTGLAFGILDSVSIPALHTEAYYNGKYDVLNSTKNYVKNGITPGFEISYLQADTVRLKRIQAGVNTTITRNADSSLTIAATGDGVGATGLTGDVTTSGSLPTLTATISTGAVTNTKIGANAVTNDKLRTSAAYSVMGNSTGATAQVADIAAITNGHVLRLSGTALGFGTLDSVSVPALHSEAYFNGKYLAINNVKNYVKNGLTAGVELSYLQADTVRLKRLVAGANTTITRNTDSSLTIASTPSVPTFSLTNDVTGTYNPTTNSVPSTIAANSVSDGKIRQSAAYSVMGRSTGTGGNVADIAATTSGQVLRLSGTALGFGTIDSTSIPALHTEAYYNGKYLGINNVKNYIKNTTGGVNMTYQQSDTVRVKSLVAAANASITRNADSSLTVNAIPSGATQTIQYNNGGAFGSITNMVLSDNILGGKDVDMYNGLLRYGSSDGRVDLTTPPTYLMTSDNFYIKRYNYPLQQGTYVPTIIFNTTNAITPSFSSAYFTRTGNTVEVWGSFTVGHTTAGLATQVVISLPIGVSTMAINQLVGNGFLQATNYFLPIVGDATYVGANFYYLAPITTVRTYQYHFRYFISSGGA